MIGVNLIDPDVLAKRARARHLRRWTIALVATGALACIPAGIHLVHRSRINGLETRDATVAANLSQARTDLARLSTKIRTIQQDIERARALREKRGWSALIALLARNLPEDVWLDSLATDPTAPSNTSPGSRQPGSAFRGAQPPKAGPVSPTVASAGALPQVQLETPRKLVLKGHARRYAAAQEFLARLQETDVFSRVASGALTRQEGPWGEAFTFELICEW